MYRLAITRASSARPRPLAGAASGVLLAAVLLVRPAGVLPAHAAPQPSQPSAATCAAVNELKRQGTYASLMAAVRDAGYRVRQAAGASGAYAAANAAQGFESRFANQSVEIVPHARPNARPNARPKAPPGSARPLRLRFTSWSRGGKLQVMSRGRPVARGSRLEYRRGAVTEWYENRPEGIEQGFTIADPSIADCGLRIAASPRLCAGADWESDIHTPTLPHSHTPTRSLTLRLAVEGGYRVRVAGDGASAAFTPLTGGAAFRYSGLKAWDARGQGLPARLMETPPPAPPLRGEGGLGRQESLLELRVADAGAVYPITIDPLLTTETELTADDGAAGDSLGQAAAVSGSTALVGAPGRNGSRGAAYVFRRVNGAWVQQTVLTASDAAANDFFGASVALDGETALIGAYGRSGNTGAAYVFVGSGSAWSQQAKLTAAADAASNDDFGFSVALSGDTGLVGALRKGSFTGAAYVFTRSGTAWSQQAKLTASDAAVGDRFGFSVALAGDTALLGAPGKTSFTGAAYVFVRSGSVWTQQKKLAASDGAANDDLGWSVALSDDTALAGAYNKNGGTGAAYVFTRAGTAWSQQQELIAADGAAGDFFGYAVALSGNNALVGAYGKNGATGAAYVLVRIGSAWSRQAEVTAADGEPGDGFGLAVALSGNLAVVGPNNKSGAIGAAYVENLVTGSTELLADAGAANDRFGNGVAISGDTALVGAPQENANRGAAYVFVRSGVAWNEQQRLTASDGVADDHFGGSVSLSGDAALVGAEGKNGAVGAAYVFRRSGTAWSQEAALTASDGAASDHFGYSLALSGETALVGAYVKNSFAGAAYLFVRSGAAWTQQQEVTADDSAGGDFFGTSAALSGNTALVGADGKNGQIGAAYVFTRTGTTWTQQQKLTAVDGAGSDGFGNSVALSGETALVGALGNKSVGAAYVFVRGGSRWGQRQKLTAPNGALADQFGYAVALSGETALVGTGTLGAAYVFAYGGGVWSQQRELTPADGARSDEFGYSVALSGATALVGAPQSGSVGAAYTFEAAPYAPLSLAGRAMSPTEVDLSWIGIGGIESGFEIERSVGEGGWQAVLTADPDETRATDLGLLPNTLYTYRIRAVNDGGPGEWSELAAVTTPDLGGGGAGPAAPTSLAATALSSTQVKLTWGAAPGSVTGYELQRTVTNSQIWSPVGTTLGNVTLAFDNDAQPGTAYTYRIRSVDASGTSAWVAGAQVTTPGPPALPTNLAALALSATQVRLSWTDTSNNETGFEIQRAVNSSQLWNTIATTTGNVTLAFDNDVHPSTTYSYRMRSVNNYGGSLWTVAALVTTPSGLPAAPSGLTATVVSAAQINLSFTDNSTDETSFELQVHAGNEPWNLLGTLDANVHTASDLGLTAATLYSYRVRAVNGIGASAWSAVATSTTQNGASSGLALHARAGKGKRIQLTWKGHAHGTAAFTIERKEGKTLGAERFAAVGSGSLRASQWVDRQVKAGVTYTYRLRRGAGAQAAYSNAASALAARR